MAKNLVIVESPAKARTLEKYLGRDFTVKASVGHVMDLPKSKLGVDIENDFAPEYQVIHGKKKIIDELQEGGEGQGEHLPGARPGSRRRGDRLAHRGDARRARRRQHPPRAVQRDHQARGAGGASSNPQELDRNLYEAQQTRRILDRLVGYQISPLLWKKVRRGLSAGRVQSVAVRIICEREREIQAFVAEGVLVDHRAPRRRQPAAVRGAPVPHRRRQARSGEVPRRERGDGDSARRPPARRRRGWSRRSSARSAAASRRRRSSPRACSRKRRASSATRRAARCASRSSSTRASSSGGEGAVGLITYMRTDSTRIAPEALQQVREFIGERYGEEYLPEQPVSYPSKKGAQDAHEAIRPTSLRTPRSASRAFLSKEELALYTLIWNRFVASQMVPAVFDQTTVDITAADTLFRATGQIMKFDGFIRVYTEGRDDERKEDDEDDESERQLPPLREGERLKLRELLPEQHFTQPPPRFSQATLIKELEEKGIGRPSTYASDHGRRSSTRSTSSRTSQRRLRPTELGFLVTDLLVDAFPDILNVEFTAGMEDDARRDRGRQGEVGGGDAPLLRRRSRATSSTPKSACATSSAAASRPTSRARTAARRW